MIYVVVCRVSVHPGFPGFVRDIQLMLRLGPAEILTPTCKENLYFYYFMQLPFFPLMMKVFGHYCAKREVPHLQKKEKVNET